MHPSVNSIADFRCIFLLDEDRIIEVNQQACDSLGYPREELLGTPVIDLEMDKTENLIQNRKQEIAVPTTTLRINRISERLQAEKALKESEEKYRLLVSQIPAVVYQGYVDWSIDFFDQKVEALTGYLKEEFDCRKVKWTDLILLEDLAEARSIFITALKGDRSFVREYRIRSKAGEVRSIQDRGQIYCDDAGKIDYIKGIFFDITERKRAEEKLQESEENLHYLASQLLTAQERERQRISRDLHDDLGQSLMSLKLQLRGIEREIPANLKKLKRLLNSQTALIDDIVNDVRRFSRDLRPAILDDIGLIVALERLFDEFGALHGIEFSLDLDDVVDLLSPQAQIIVYRILQESLTNIGKYSQATRITISLKRENDKVSLCVEDNGKGFDLEQFRALDVAKRGLGLAAMEERVRMLGGILEIQSQIGVGTIISFKIPVQT